MPSIPSADFMFLMRVLAWSTLVVAIGIIAMIPAIFIAAQFYILSEKIKQSNKQKKKIKYYRNFVGELVKKAQPNGTISCGQINFGKCTDKFGKIESSGIAINMRISQAPFAKTSIPCCKELENYLQSNSNTQSVIVLSGINGLGKTFSTHYIAETLSPDNPYAVSVSVKATDLMKDPNAGMENFFSLCSTGTTREEHVDMAVRIKENLKNIMKQTNESLKKAGITNANKVLAIDELDMLIIEVLKNARYRNEKWLADLFTSMNQDFQQFGFKVVASMNRSFLIENFYDEIENQAPLTREEVESLYEVYNIISEPSSPRTRHNDEYYDKNIAAYLKNNNENLKRFVKAIHGMNGKNQHFKFKKMTKNEALGFIESLESRREIENFLDNNINGNDSHTQRTLTDTQEYNFVKNFKESCTAQINNNTTLESFDLRGLSSCLSDIYTKAFEQTINPSSSVESSSTRSASPNLQNLSTTAS